MQSIIVKIPRRKQRVRIIRTEELIQRELKNLPKWEDEIEEIIVPEPEIIEEVEPEPELPKEVITRFTESFVITNSNQPMEISLKNIPTEESLPISEVVLEVQSAYDKGFLDGQESSNAAYQSEIFKYKEWIKRIDSLTKSMKVKFSKELDLLEKSLIPISVMTANHIILKEVDSDTNIVINQVKRAIKSIGEENIFKISLHPDDIDILSEVKSELVSDNSKIKNVEITADKTIDRGFCVLSTSAGIIDATLNTQLSKVKHSLSEVFAQPSIQESLAISKQQELDDIYSDIYDDSEISG